MTQPLGEFVRKSYLPSAVVILDEAHRMFLEESAEEGFLEMPSFQGALFTELESAGHRYTPHASGAHFFL